MYLRPEPELGWLPTHVQVTILQARGLRAKGKHGTSDAFTLIQIGREKYSTSVVEKSPGSPEWKEECTFELAPGAMERGEGSELLLTAMHRALIGMDQFLGQVSIPLQEVYQQGRSLRNQWYNLRSKPGKKEKQRGEIQVSIQFTRNNLTASMFDLSIKDKPKTPFGKLKDKLKVKKLFDMESSSAIVPSSVGRLDSDDEDDRKPKSKAALFFKGRLRKSSLTKSNTSLGSDSTISSASGTAPSISGISIVLPDASKKPASRNSSLSTEPAVKDHESSPRMTHKRAFSDEVSQLKVFLEPKAVQELKPKSSPISKSSLCINGSHVYTEVPLPKPPPSPLEKSAPASRSFQNIAKRTEDAPVTEGPPGYIQVSEKAERKIDWKPPVSTTSSLEETKISAKTTIRQQNKEDVRPEPSKPIQITSPMVFTENVSKNRAQENTGKEEKKPKVNLFHHGTNKNEAGGKSLVEQTADESPHPEERNKAGSWFGSKDAKETSQKPSFPFGSIATSEAAEGGSSLVEEHSPLAFSPSAESPKEPLHPCDSCHQEVVFEALQSKATPSCTSEPIVLSEWEEQFDAFASSRLQPASSSLTPPDHSGSLNSPSSSTEGTRTGADASRPVESGHSVNLSTGLFTSHLGVKVLETQWPANPAEDPKTETVFPLAASHYTPHLPSVPSARIGTPMKDFSVTHDKSKAVILVKPTTDYERKTLSAQRHLGEDGASTPLSETSFSPQEHVSQNIYYVEESQNRGAEQDDCGDVHKPGEGMIAVVSPRLLEDLPDAQLLYCPSSSQLDQPGSDPTSTSSYDTGNQGNKRSGVDILQGLQYSTVPAGGACSESISTKLYAAWSEETSTEVVNRPAIKSKVLSEIVGSMVPPKPPRLLSAAAESKLTDADNCKQTSHQDAGKKQMVNPEEQRRNPNMGACKQLVSPVACCPVIEVINPAQSVGEDTQSATKGSLTNFKDEINDLTKLGGANGEHLLDVNESTVAEQFRTCPSKVSQDALDLSSAGESSSKLDVLKLSPDSELINHGPAGQHVNSGGVKPESEKFLKLLPVPKKERSGERETSNSSKRVDHSNLLFWSALEEPPSIGPNDRSGLKQDVVATHCEIVDPECEGGIGPGDKVKNITKLDHKSTQLERARKPQNDPVVDQQSAKQLRAGGQRGLSSSRLSSWSADIIVDFKNEDFWRSESDLLEAEESKSLPSPGNPFTPTDETPPILSQKNPFVESTPSSELSLEEDLSFKDLHARAALKVVPNASLPTNVNILSLHGNQPLAFSTPSLLAAQNTTLSNLPSPILSSTTAEATGTTNTHTATLSCLQSPPTSRVVKPAGLSLLPQETQPAESPFMPQKTSPHPVKPISATLSDSGSEKKPSKPALTTALTSGLEMLKSVTSVHQLAPKKPDLDRLKDLCSPDVAAQYYHLTHDELIHMLLQKEAELGRKEVHVRELEDYIDKLLVRIMDQAPTLLQAPLETPKDTK
ncbi:rab11 family-interacting protein 5 isoform 1-T1 [Pelodytes ibericus]